MQDFTLPPNVMMHDEAIARRLTDEQFMASPRDMYLYALALRGKLPDHLHQSMMMWSFVPKQNQYAQMYLEWVTSCEERKLAKERWERKFARNDRIIRILMSCWAFFVIALAVASSILLIQESIK
jgi:hypothetical protein